jgi:hypothetical protein
MAKQNLACCQLSLCKLGVLFLKSSPGDEGSSQISVNRAYIKRMKKDLN